MKKNRDYDKNLNKKHKRLFGRTKSNRDDSVNPEDQRAEAEHEDTISLPAEIRPSAGPDEEVMDAEYVETERTEGSDPSKVEKIGNMFVPKQGKRLLTNRYMLYTSFLVVALFAGLIVYLVHFTIYEAPAIITSPYNKRTAALSENVIRGSIKSANGKILAETRKDDEGEEYRSYPYERTFAHVVGYASHGKGGLESSLNYELLTSHERLTEQFKRGITGKKMIGDTMCTTLDTRLQKRAYEALGDRDGAIIAIEPATGKVRAMVSKPDFDPNSLDEDWEDINTEDGSSLLNRAVQGIYPPGSTYKTLTALEYIEENPGTWKQFKYKCTGKTVINSVRIRCFGDTSHGKETLAYAFAHSCNTAFVTLGSQLNLKTFLDLNKRFLFQEKISFDLPVKQSRPGLHAKSKKSDIPQAVIGQGDTLMTPFHNALIMCAIANDGILMKPTLLDHIESADGIVISKRREQQWKRLADESDCKILAKLLRRVVTDGTGHALNTDDYSVAGKTGTAEHGGKKDHSWFVGYSNVKDPDLVVCVLVENGGAGSEVAAPVAAEIFDSYYSNEMYKKYRSAD